MWIVLFDLATGGEIGRTWRLSPPSPDLLARIKEVDFAAPDAPAWVSDQEPGAGPLVATIEGGEVVSVAVAPAATAPELWLHVVVTGGSYNPLTGTRYVQRGDLLNYAGAIRETSDPESPVVPAVPGSDPPAPLTLAWALEMIHELGSGQWSPLIPMTAGEASGVATVPERLADGLYTLPEERLAKIGAYRLRLADPLAWQLKVVDGPAA
jgi:hypothetical protein